MPSAVGYQPNSSQMRWASSRSASRQPWTLDHLAPGDLCVPADDCSTDLGTGDDLRTPRRDTELSREIASQGLYPAVDPLTSTSRIPDPPLAWVPTHHCVATNVARRSRRRTRSCRNHRDPRRCRRASGGRQDHRFPAPHAIIQQFLLQNTHMAKQSSPASRVLQCRLQGHHRVIRRYRQG
jgi:F-type H+-transporting ATPase subunit beta